MRAERLRMETVQEASAFLDCSSEIIRAYEYARECHRGQIRLDGDEYITHPVRVAVAVARYAEGKLSCSEARTAIIAALLHDVVEDTAATVNDVSRLFGEEVASIVLALSRKEGEKVGKQYLARVKWAGPIAVLVKRYDRLDNIQTLVRAPKRFRNRKKAEALTVLPIWRALDPVGALLIQSALAKV